MSISIDILYGIIYKMLLLIDKFMNSKLLIPNFLSPQYFDK